jgi:hypothetical protein
MKLKNLQQRIRAYQTTVTDLEKKRTPKLLLNKLKRKSSYFECLYEFQFYDLLIVVFTRRLNARNGYFTTIYLSILITTIVIILTKPKIPPHIP